MTKTRSSTVNPDGCDGSSSVSASFAKTVMSKQQHRGGHQRLPPPQRRQRIALIVIVIVGCSIFTFIMNSRLLLHVTTNMMPSQSSSSSSSSLQLLAPQPSNTTTTTQTEVVVTASSSSSSLHEQQVPQDEEEVRRRQQPSQQIQVQEQDKKHDGHHHQQDRQQQLPHRGQTLTPPRSPHLPTAAQPYSSYSHKHKPYLILHVGPPKTATTTIQCNLEKYSDLLVELDKVYFIGAACDHAITHRQRRQGGRVGNGNGIGGIVRHNFTMINGITPPLINPLLYAIGYKGEHKLTKEQLDRAHQPMYEFQKNILEYHNALNHSIIYSVEQFSKRLPHTQQVYDRINMLFNTNIWNVHIISTYRRYYDWLYSNYYQDYHINLYTNQWYKNSYNNKKGSKDNNDNKGRNKELRQLTPSFQSIVEKHISVWNGTVPPPKKEYDSLAYGEHLALRAYHRYNEYLNTNIGGTFNTTSTNPTTTTTTRSKGAKAHVKLFDYHYHEMADSATTNDLFTNFVCQMLTPAAYNTCHYLQTHNDHADHKNGTSHRQSDHDVIDSARLAEVSYKRLFVDDNDNNDDGNNGNGGGNTTTPPTPTIPSISKQYAMKLLQQYVIDPILLLSTTTTNNNYNSDGNTNDDKKKNSNGKEKDKNKLNSIYFSCDYPTHLKDQFLSLSLHYEQEFLKYSTSKLVTTTHDGDYYYNYDESKRLEMIRNIFHQNFQNGKYCEIDPNVVFDDPKWNQVIREQVFQVQVRS